MTTPHNYFTNGGGITRYGLRWNDSGKYVQQINPANGKPVGMVDEHKCGSFSPDHLKHPGVSELVFQGKLMVIPFDRIGRAPVEAPTAYGNIRHSSANIINGRV